MACENVLRLAASRDLKNRNPPGRNGHYYCYNGVMDIRLFSEDIVRIAEFDCVFMQLIDLIEQEIFHGFHLSG